VLVDDRQTTVTEHPNLRRGEACLARIPRAGARRAAPVGAE